MGAKKSVLVVSSAFNEESCLPELFQRLKRVAQAEEHYDFQFLFFDNGSRDRTWSIIEDFSKSEKNVRGIKFSRNFPLDTAFSCGLDLAESDAVIVMASDLQDPPEKIPELLRKWEEGFSQVMVRVNRRDHVPIIRRLLSTIYYKIAGLLSDGLLPEKVSDFRLLSREVYVEVRKLREHHRYFRGLAVWVGFSSATIEIERPARFAGTSSWLATKFLRVSSNAAKNIYSFSSKPLSLLALIGVVFSLISLVLLVFYSGYLLLVEQPPFDGFGTLMGVLILGFSLNFLGIGIVAQYVGMIFAEVKRRPLYVIEEDTSKKLNWPYSADGVKR